MTTTEKVDLAYSRTMMQANMLLRAGLLEDGDGYSTTPQVIDDEASGTGWLMGYTHPHKGEEWIYLCLLPADKDQRRLATLHWRGQTGARHAKIMLRIDRESDVDSYDLMDILALLIRCIVTHTRRHG